MIKYPLICLLPKYYQKYKQQENVLLPRNSETYLVFSEKVKTGKMQQGHVALDAQELITGSVPNKALLVRL
jgi:hypothetical protein